VARSGEWAQHFSNASCRSILNFLLLQTLNCHAEFNCCSASKIPKITWQICPIPSRFPRHQDLRKIPKSGDNGIYTVKNVRISTDIMWRVVHISTDIRSRS